MVRTSPFRSRLQVESLEAREVPAVVVNGTYPAAAITLGTTPTPNGGTVSIQEVAIAATDVTFNEAFTATESVSRSEAANDNITVSLSGSTLNIRSDDGVFIRFTVGGVTFLYNAGNDLDVPNASRLDVFLQLGGDDALRDNTTLPAALNGGPGNDNVVSVGFEVNSGALLLGSPIDPALFPLLGQAGGLKTIFGGDGNDSLTGPLFGFFNTIDGGAGDDVIVGGLGPDILNGGTGLDILNGFGGGDFYLSLDLNIDYNLNVTGDSVVADSFDILSTPI